MSTIKFNLWHQNNIEKNAREKWLFLWWEENCIWDLNYPIHIVGTYYITSGSKIKILYEIPLRSTYNQLFWSKCNFKDFCRISLKEYSTFLLCPQQRSLSNQSSSNCATLRTLYLLLLSSTNELRGGRSWSRSIYVTRTRAKNSRVASETKQDPNMWVRRIKPEFSPFSFWRRTTSTRERREDLIRSHNLFFLSTRP